MGPKKDFNSRQKARNWLVVINNPENGFCLGFNEETDQYMICGEEHNEYDDNGIRTKDQGTPHIQGFVQLKSPTLGSAVKKRWPRAHLEVTKHVAKYVEYCTKEGKSHDHGELLKGQGARSDLDAIKSVIDGGGSLFAIRELSYGSYLRYQKSIIADRQLILPDRDWPTELHIRWGATGSGKSRYCRETFPGAFWKTRGEWWDGYDGHETIIIDDFYGWLRFDDLLRLADRNPLRVPYKGGFVKCVAKRAIITSNKDWREWYPNVTEPELWNALQRRITTCVEFRRSNSGAVGGVDEFEEIWSIGNDNRGTNATTEGSQSTCSLGQ